jgi:mannosyltransferase OCH1-like enzyme
MIYKFIQKCGSQASRLHLNIKSLLNNIKAKIKSFLTYQTEYPLVQLAPRKAVMVLADSHLIPPTVIQLWAAKSFGKTHSTAIEEFRSINTDISFLLFDDNESNAYIENNWGTHPIHEIYKSSRFGPLKADIFRYCMLYELGGYYFDINKGCSVPLRSLHLPSDRRLLSYEASFCSVLPDLRTARCFQYPNRYLIQWGFGFAPKDPILKRVIELICAYYPLFKGKEFQDPKSAILAFTGPGMFTKAVREVVQAEGRFDGAQAGINFNGHGIPWMPGSEVRYHLSPPYVLARNAVIVN